jgi:hypothetical protein
MAYTITNSGNTTAWSSNTAAYYYYPNSTTAAPAAEWHFADEYQPIAANIEVIDEVQPEPAVEVAIRLYGRFRMEEIPKVDPNKLPDELFIIEEDE